jgi:hypothetical protein
MLNVVVTGYCEDKNCSIHKQRPEVTCILKYRYDGHLLQFMDAYWRVQHYAAMLYSPLLNKVT